MLPTSQEIARQIAVVAELHPELSTSEIAAELALSPIFIINAIEEGVRMELFTSDKVNDKINLIAPLDFTDGEGYVFGEENTRVQDEIIHLLRDQAAIEQDIDLGQLMNWCRGIRPSAVGIALHVLEKLELVATYELADPNDKESKYTFLTLERNRYNQWGEKQFKDKK